MALGQAGRPRAVVCLSGGMDSCVCAALAARDYETYAIHFSYGQRTEARELRSAQEVARIIGVRELLPLKMDLFRHIGGSALTDPAIPVPGRLRRTQPGIGSAVPVTYVPFRNAHFLSRSGKLGRGPGSENGLYQGSRAGQLGVSGLPAGLLRRLQSTHPDGHERRGHPGRDPLDRHAQKRDRPAGS